MQPFDFCLAFGPLAIYLVLLGWINLRRRPLVINGARETANLGVALAGLLMIGPMQLFVPEATAVRLGPLAWGLLLSFYGLTLTLWILLARPRLVVYNIRGAQLRSVLAEVALELDTEARWAGDSLSLPQLGVQCYVESFPWMRNVSLVASSDSQSFGGWRRLERRLRRSLTEVEVRPNPRGIGLLAAGTLLLAGMVLQAVNDPQAVASGFWEMLRR